MIPGTKRQASLMRDRVRQFSDQALNIYKRCFQYREARAREKKAQAKANPTAKEDEDVDEDGDELDEEPAAKRRKDVYGWYIIDLFYYDQRIFAGVNNTKWHVKVKVSPQARLLLSQCNSEADFERREDVFERSRSVLCVEFRFIHIANQQRFHSLNYRSSLGKKIGEICRSFFEDPRHLVYHFSYVADVPPLNDEIEKNFITFMGRPKT